MFSKVEPRFNLTPINGHGVAEIEDRSDIYPYELLKITLIPNETADLLITHPQN